MWTFLSPPFYLVQYQHEKRLTNQPDALPDEGFLGTAAPVGTHFRFPTFLARDLRGLASIKVYFSFVNVSDSLGPSSEHNSGWVIGIFSFRY